MKYLNFNIAFAIRKVKLMKVVILAGGLGTRLSEYTKNSKADGKNK